MALGGLVDFGFGFGSGLAGLAGASCAPPAERKNPEDPVGIDAAKGADLKHYHKLNSLKRGYRRIKQKACVQLCIRLVNDALCKQTLNGVSSCKKIMQLAI